jgi:hypothetical protein
MMADYHNNIDLAHYSELMAMYQESHSEWNHVNLAVLANTNWNLYSRAQATTSALPSIHGSRIVEQMEGWEHLRGHNRNAW